MKTKLFSWFELVLIALLIFILAVVVLSAINFKTYHF